MLALLLAATVACGTERWPEKILADPAAAHLNLAPRVMTIEQLNALPPTCSKGNAERSGLELQLVRVTGTVKVVKRERDGDLHIVLADAAGQTVVVESPSATCAAPSRFRTVLRAARAKAEALRPGQLVTVDGPVFFDFFHGQTGMSRSCAEVHPVMRVTAYRRPMPKAARGR